jgi:hypothetical protein
VVRRDKRIGAGARSVHSAKLRDHLYRAARTVQVAVQLHCEAMRGTGWGWVFASLKALRGIDGADGVGGVGMGTRDGGSETDHTIKTNKFSKFVPFSRINMTCFDT